MRILKESFNAGEFTPRLHSRYELAKYKNGCKTLANFVALPHGPITRRPGFEYIAEVKTSSKFTDLIPFEFSEEDSYIIESGHNYTRYYRNGGQIQTEDANTSLLVHFDGTNYSTTFTDSGSTGHTITAVGDAKLKTDYYKFGSASGYFDGSGDRLTIPDHADWNFSTSEFTIDARVRLNPLAGSGTYAICGQYDDATHYYAMWIVLSGAVQSLRFYAINGASTISLIYTTASTQPDSFLNGNFKHVAVVRGWGGVTNDWALCLNGIAEDTETNSITMPDLAGTFIIGYVNTNFDFYGHIDELRVSKGIARWEDDFTPPPSQYPGGDDSGTVAEDSNTYDEEELPYIDYVQSADTIYLVHKNHIQAKLVRSDHDSWALSNLSFTDAPAAWGAADYPRTVELYEDRLCFGGNPSYPDTIWGSKTGEYTVFTEGVNDDDPFTHTLGSRKVNDIQWLSASRKLLAGTHGEEWWLSGPSDTEPITYADKVAKRDSALGSERIKPIDIGDSVFYVQKAGKIVREISYDYGKDKYISTDVRILAEHLTRDYYITKMAYQQHPYQILWCVRSDGTLISLSYLKEHDVIGWHRHTSGSGAFESVAVIPGDTEDELWAVVRREIDGSTVRYIERMKPFNFGSSLDDAFYVDCGLTYDGAPTTTISGLDHLEGESVSVLADGVVVTGKTVSSGSITLDNEASKVHIGLAYTPEFESLDIVTQDNEGTLQSVTKRVTNIKIKLINSMGGLYGTSSSSTDSIPYDDETEPFTGWTADLEFDEGFDDEATIYITSNEPLPLEIAAIMIDLED